MLFSTKGLVYDRFILGKHVLRFSWYKMDWIERERPFLYFDFESSSDEKRKQPGCTSGSLGNFQGNTEKMENMEILKSKLSGKYRKDGKYGNP